MPEQLPLPVPQKKRARTGRQPLPDYLPRIEHRHEPQSCQCKQCGSELVKIGEDVTEQLDVKPAEFFVHRHIRPQYACHCIASHKSQRAYLWVYRSNDFELGPRIIAFDYQTSRSGKHAQDFLDGWQGHLVVDDYAGYKPLFTLGNCTELGCWAHARRKFFDLHQANASSVAFEALQRIGKLYAVEDEGKHLSTEARQILRAEKSLPPLQSLHNWLLQTRAQTADGGGTAKASSASPAADPAD